MSSPHLRVTAFAKVNLHLSILGRRYDGFHEIDSVAHRVSWGDRVEISPIPGGEVRLVIVVDRRSGRPSSSQSSRPRPELPLGPDNLAWKAARWLQETFGVDAGAEIRLYKQIPVGAGLGGGSADAAAVVRGLRRLWGLRVTAQHLRALATVLGADVPFLLGGRAGRLRGTGDRIDPLPAWPGLFLVVLPLPRAVSTAWAYAAWDRWQARTTAGRRCQDASRFVRLFRQRDLVGMAREAANDFEPVVEEVYPEVTEALAVLRRAGALTARLTGSGSAVWGLFGGARAAHEAWQRLRSLYPQARVVRTL